MFYLNKLKEYIGIFYYRHGLFCASHPVAGLLLVSVVVCICCYPLKNIQSFNSSLEQYKQSLNTFDGLEASTDLNDNVEYEKLAEKPKWYNRIPVAYIQRIVVRSVFEIPISNEQNNRTNRLYLIDIFRTPLAQLFELNEFFRAFQMSSPTFDLLYPQNQQHKSLTGDLCVHVTELSKNAKSIIQSANNKDFNRHVLPEFSCLYLSPANFWSNDYSQFLNDDDLLATIANSLSTSSFDQSDEDEESSSSSSSSSFWASIFSYLFKSSSSKPDRITNIRELLFGVSWLSTIKTAKEREAKSKSVVFTYAITIALRKYDSKFLGDLKQKLEAKFGLEIEIDDKDDDKHNDSQNHIYNLQYTIQGLIYYIPFVLLYLLLFIYIYISVRKIEFVKSKWGLAFAAVTQIILSLLMSVGICSYFGLTPTLSGSEIFPYLIIFIGFENIVVLTKSVVSTPFDLDVRYRIALGLKKESWVITKILTFELIIICSGLFTMVPAIQEFCLFAWVGLLIDFFMQMIFFVTVLSIDIRRMELSDLNKNAAISSTNKLSKMSDHSLSSKAMKKSNSNEPTSGIINSDKLNKLNYRGDRTLENSADITTNREHNTSSKGKLKRNSSSLRKLILDANYGTFFMNKSAQFFYFWARTRLVQRAIMVLSALWIFLIFYKSMLIVELMRHDVNVNKETVEAFLPKGVEFPKTMKHASSYMLTTASPSFNTATVSLDESTTIDYIKKHFQNLVLPPLKSNRNQNPEVLFDSADSTKAAHFRNAAGADSTMSLMNEDDLYSWKKLSPYHWLTLFSFYNISLYNRYVAILPEINLKRNVKPSDLISFRNENEIKKYNTHLSIDSKTSRLIIEGSSSTLFDLFNLDNNSSETSSADKNNNENIEANVNVNSTAFQTYNYKQALLELFGIVVFGLPAIFSIVYAVIFLYKCFCSKNYEEWRSSWTTTSIKRQYYIMHKQKRRAKKLSSRGVLSKGKYTENSKHWNQEIIDNNSSSENNTNSSDDEDDECLDEFNVKDKRNESDMNKNYCENDMQQMRSNSDNRSVLNDNQTEDMIEKIINGKMDEIDLIPLKRFNTNWNSLEKHQYPIDLLFCGSKTLATSDISNQIKIWPLESSSSIPSDNIKTIKLNEHQNISSEMLSIWSISLDETDRYLFVGFSNGTLKSFDLETNYSIDFTINAPIGITHIINISSNLFKTADRNSSVMLLGRLNGYVELVEFCPSSAIVQLDLIEIFHTAPLIYLLVSGDYIIASGQDAQLKVLRVNSSPRSSSSAGKSGYLNVMYDLTGYVDSPVTSICVDRESSINAATGTQNGVIYVWNLFTGDCILKFNRNKGANSKSQSADKMSSIVKIEMTGNFIISMSSDHTMYIWNRKTGILIREYRFLSPTLMLQQRKSEEIYKNNDKIKDGSINIFAERNESTLSTFKSYALKFVKFVYPNYQNRKLKNKKFFIQPFLEKHSTLPTMCLYSNSILITGGCSSIFLWNIHKGDLIKKINLRNQQSVFQDEANLEIENQIKEIKVVNISNDDAKFSRVVNKLVVVTDYTDSMYVIRIPKNIVKNFDF